MDYSTGASESGSRSVLTIRVGSVVVTFRSENNSSDIIDGSGEGTGAAPSLCTIVQCWKQTCDITCAPHLSACHLHQTGSLMEGPAVGARAA